MGKKYGLRCFYRSHKFKSKDQVYRDENEYPICRECLEEYLYDCGFWQDAAVEWILQELDKPEFNRNYKKFKKYYEQNYVCCEGEHGYDELWRHKDDMNEINGKYYCELCIELREEEK
ncbi:MAG: hypothetical protein GF317_20820 [Candidatus Lokiarchaeota archaeon]|nr:hypothetical protein [Candidatus Lokiarchaeota archaeon]